MFLEKTPLSPAHPPDVTILLGNLNTASNDEVTGFTTQCDLDNTTYSLATSSSPEYESHVPLITNEDEFVTPR
ncbi:hypothetical protein J6590_070332 [Homalodisca vitripennis]|nr:hypothetical protein J6590_070332 [Homalodisca vitripennis]